MDSWVGLVGALAWPATVFGLAWMFRVETRRVLGRLNGLKFHDLEATFLSELRAAEAVAGLPGPGGNASPPKIVRELNPPGFEPSPRRAVLNAWDRVEDAARTVGTGPGEVEAGGLIRHGLTDGPSLLLFDRLRRLRDQVAQTPEFEPSAAEARRFTALADRLVARLAGLASDRPAGSDSAVGCVPTSVRVN